MATKYERLADLFRNGPEGLRGDLEACSLEAGFLQPVSPTNPHLVRALKRIADEEATKPKLPKIELPPDGVGDEVWRQKALELLPAYEAAARGELQIDPQQRLTMKDIIDRGLGKAGAQPATQVLPGVVILPALGSGKDAAIPKELIEKVEKGSEI